MKNKDKVSSKNKNKNVSNEKPQNKKEKSNKFRRTHTLRVFSVHPKYTYIS